MSVPESPGGERLLTPSQYLRQDGSIIGRFKQRFRELDLNRNGMLEFDEIKKLLSSVPEKDLKMIWSRLDVDQDGMVSFDEFVDFVFMPKDTNLMDASEVDKMRQDYEEEQKIDLASSVQFLGATHDQGLNGIMLKNERTEAESDILNGYPIYNKGKGDWRKQKLEIFKDKGTEHFKTGAIALPMECFYAWNRKDERAGWFVAESRPDQLTQMVDNFLLFNHTPNAETPDQCAAMWEMPNGQKDKRMFCENSKYFNGPCFEETPQDGILDEELWEDGESDDDHDFKEGNFEEEWAYQTYEASDGDDGWEDDWVRYPAYEAVAKAENTTVTEVKKKEIGFERQRSKRSGNAEKQNDEAIVEFVHHAPGFQIKADSDHLAFLGKKKSQAGKEKDGWKMDHSRESKKTKAKVKVKELDGTEGWETYKDGLYIDKDFPPCARSLGAPMSNVTGWTRLSKLHAQPKLFHRIVPDCVLHQAFAGNLWFLSACAVAAEYPAWIKSMFGGKATFSADGIYRVRLYHPGKQCFVRVVVDDYVPTNNGGPAFAGVTGFGEIWVALVEKAFAKLCGSYAQTEWGLNAHGMHYICGGGFAASWSRLGPSRWKRSRTVWNGGDEDGLDRQHVEGVSAVGNWRDEDDVWTMLRMSMERCYPIACGVDKEQAEAVGLRPDRSYSLIAAREVPVDDGWVFRIVLMRNPYGIGEWTGRWCDDSEAWEQSPLVKKNLEFEAAEDGTFWMAFNDFVKHFAQIDIVRKSLPVQGANRGRLAGIKRGLGKNLGIKWR